MTTTALEGQSDCAQTGKAANPSDPMPNPRTALRLLFVIAMPQYRYASTSLTKPAAKREPYFGEPTTAHIQDACCLTF
jgi:hypothetical protein